MISHLNNLIQDKYIIKSSGSTYVIQENAEKKFPKTSLKVSGRSILCKFDNDKKLLHFFKDVHGAKFMSDYVLFVEFNNTVHIFIIELKTSKVSNKQHLATKLFTEYIENTAKRCFNLSEKCIYRNILVIKNFVLKKPTKPSKLFIKQNLEILKAGYKYDISLYCVNN